MADSMQLLYFAGGLVLLFVGAEVMLRGTTLVATHLKIPRFIIGLTVIAFGTSAPELFVSVQASYKNMTGIAIGNIIGSNLANILLVLGVAKLFGPIVYTTNNRFRDAGVLIFSTWLLISQALCGSLGYIDAFLSLSALVIYLGWCFLGAQKHYLDELPEDPVISTHFMQKPAIAAVMLLGGIALTLFAADLIVSSGSALARAYGISEATIGLTLVALGTSLPELATLIASARQKQIDVAVGSVIGSNIFNALGVTGVIAIMNPGTPIPPSIIGFDLWVMTAITLVFVALILLRKKIGYKTALFYFMLYVAYCTKHFFL